MYVYLYIMLIYCGVSMCINFRLETEVRVVIELWPLA